MKEWKYLDLKVLQEIIDRHQRELASNIIVGGFQEIKPSLMDFYREIATLIRDNNK